MPTAVTVRRHARRSTKTKRPLGFVTLGFLILILSLIAAYFIFGFPETVQEINYPMAYREQITRCAEAYGLDPARVAAVVYCESSFLPDAVSPVGARGLMQIMPDTGEWLAGKLDLTDYTPDMLFDPEISLNMGCWYLKYLDGRFGGDLVTVTAAYHTGQGNVDKWLEDKGNSPDGVTLTSIPSNATDTYVKRVRYAYDQYKELYANEPQKG